jgi:hypothetical protein
MIACEEVVTEPEPIPIVIQPFLSFMYNGKEYNSEGYEINPWGRAMGTEREWLVTEDGSIWINRPDIFGGVISYGDSNCTFLRPVHNDLDLFDCHLTIDSAAVDSTAAYFYKSGTKSFAVHDCVTKRVFDYFFGKWYTDVTCIKKGTFDLELINNENKIIRITNGKWEFNIKK